MHSVLLICHDPYLAVHVQARLSQFNCQVHVAHTAAKGLALMKNGRPSLVLIHLATHPGKGWEFCQALKQSPETSVIPILLLSDGPDGCLSLDIDSDDWAAKVKKWLKDPIGAPSHVKIDGSHSLQKTATGLLDFDQFTGGGLPQGANVLVIGKFGSGKSHLCRSFIQQGLQNQEPCLYVALDDNPLLIRQEWCYRLKASLESYPRFCMVDAYNWGGGHHESTEHFVLKGNLNLTRLGGLISDASETIGQDRDQKKGGRRVIDSLTSLMVNFSLPELQTFIFQMTRTAWSYGQITTLFTLEADTLEERLLNNLISMMDGVIELERREDGAYLRIQHMKWQQYERHWMKIDPEQSVVGKEMGQ